MNVAKKGSEKAQGKSIVCRNPKAFHLYEIEDTLEGGLSLQGSEVKSLRDRKADLDGAYASFSGDELYLQGMHIAPYKFASVSPHEPKRARKVLLRRRELEKWQGRLTMQGYTVIPLSVYFRNGWAKVELGLAKGRKLIDKRQQLKRKLDLKEARDAVSRAKLKH